jgi:hypothetical protein
MEGRGRQCQEHGVEKLPGANFCEHGEIKRKFMILFYDYCTLMLSGKGLRGKGF